ncbi:hypothetical protein SARC_00467 [Sphaeroforma arctica JP610]|uniref:Uncharacterized protein n=1 Tax=Sphaeroforma arctica JP610 TaxID=667725 RepID=A0A0L0GEI9_9EUKA|nr:hypothetical protein SARC_00467 [Sphaeroforma arctica JP610]KNC87430.1 hypothetical protein SARC_00467 [Sphaeroforma arctica JP610]|eukprot:XP_014161332.1 hypothetical protein SARC_00467 [Sphaeroforma arctica JP610]
MSVVWTAAAVYMVYVSHNVEEDVALEERAQLRRERRTKLAKMRYDERVARGTVCGLADDVDVATAEVPHSDDPVIVVQPASPGVMSASEAQALIVTTAAHPGRKESDVISFSSVESPRANVLSQVVQDAAHLSGEAKKDAIQSSLSDQSSRLASAIVYGDTPSHYIESSDDSDGSYHSAVGAVNTSDSTLTGE